MRTNLIVGCMSLFMLSNYVFAQDAAPCQVHIILFVPSDISPPTRYQPRVDQVVGYTESFLQLELKRWGHEKMVMPFRRSGDGHIEVTVIHGKQQASKYKPVAVRAEVMDEMRRTNKLAGGRQIWWIMVYVGEPPAKFDGFLGGFGPQIGGWSVCNFDTTPGQIDPGMPLGSEFLEKMALKGMIHELGHGFQMPHVGPLVRDKAGNTLMGPTHYNYRRVTGIDEDRVYLSEAEAAMLSTHPAFRGIADDREALPKPEVQNMTYSAERGKGTIVVSGRVKASQRPFYALVADESDARPGEYWTKTYAGKISSDGKFEVVISEPSESAGTLKTWFAFETGAQTGDGNLRGRDSGIPKAYTYSRQQWKFK